MSVINETLENLKQTKKRSSGSLNPASSVHCEKAEKNVVATKTYLIPISFMMLVGVIFYFSQIFSPKMLQNLQNVVKSNPETAQQAPYKLVVGTTNSSAQKMYYRAMALLNEGNEEQAALRLQEIIAQYPDFIPAKQAYSMVVVR